MFGLHGYNLTMKICLMKILYNKFIKKKTAKSTLETEKFRKILFIIFIKKKINIEPYQNKFEF